jgi:ABC-2 type transport system permease protein
MSSLAGTRALVRLALRRDRIVLPVWLYVWVALVVGTAASFKRLYPDVPSRLAFGAGVADNPALIALYGRLYDPTSIGAMTMWRVGGNGAALVGLMSVLTVVRHSRAEEETGRLELLGSGVVGRLAPLTAALLVAAGANLLIALAIVAGLTVIGLTAAGAVAFGLAFLTTGWVFCGIAAVTAQLTETARGANGIAIGVLGGSVALRAIGDSAGSGALSSLHWISPAGWAEQLRPFAGERWWVAALPLLLTFALCGLALALVSRRDLGAGLLPSRPGPAQAAPALRSPLAVAWRLQRGVLAGWTAGFALFGAVFGSIAAGIGDLLRSSAQIRDAVARMGGHHSIVDAFLASVMGIIGVAASAYAVQATLRLRTEETEQRAEPVLATAVTRIRWAASHLAFGAAGSAVVLGAAGLGAGVAHGLRTGDVATQVPRLFGAALAQLPATWVLVGIAVALFGFAPGWIPVSWGALGLFVLLGQLGPVLRLSQWVMDLSPFTHVPKVPGGELSLAPLTGLAAAAVVLTGAGLAGFRQRDIG